jgi:hypothetical protein
MRRALLALLALFVFLPLLGAASCEQKAEQDFGIQTKTDPATGKQVVTVDPTGGPVGSVVKAAADVASAIPGPGTLVSIGLNGVLTVLTGIFGLVARKRAGELNTAQTALGAAQTAISATGAALQQAVDVLPAGHAATLNTVLNAVHDAMGVLPALQDALQPNLATAGTHAAPVGTPLPAPGPAAPTPAPAG